MTVVLRAGIVVIAIVSIAILRAEFFVPKTIDCRTSVEWSGAAPHGAIWNEEAIHWETVPAGYTMLVGWINAATTIPCYDASTPTPRIEVRTLRIIATDVDGHDTLVQEIDPRDQSQFIGRLFPRIPKWFGETKGKNEGEVIARDTDKLSLLIDQVPLRVYHAWTEPRVRVDPALRYSLEIEAKVSATARLQIGIDYWRDEQSDYNGWDQACQHSNNCEGWVSDWYGDTQGEFQIFRAPRREIKEL